MKAKISIVVLVLLLMVGCATFQGRSDFELAYDILSTSYLTYDTSFTTLGTLADIGVMSESAWDEAVIVGRKYKTAHNLAVRAFDRWRKAGGKDIDKQDFYTNYNLAMDSMRDLQAIVSENRRVKRGLNTGN